MQKYKRYICSCCWSIRQARYAKANPESLVKKSAKAKERISAWSAERKKVESDRRHNNALIRSYGITLNDYKQMLGRQNGQCSICEAKDSGGKGGFHVDHCHKTGAVRSLLCTTCNMMLGMAKDDPEILRRSAMYIEHHQALAVSQKDAEA